MWQYFRDFLQIWQTSANFPEFCKILQNFPEFSQFLAAIDASECESRLIFFAFFEIYNIDFRRCVKFGDFLRNFCNFRKFPENLDKFQKILTTFAEFRKILTILRPLRILQGASPASPAHRSIFFKFQISSISNFVDRYFFKFPISSISNLSPI